MTCRTAVWIGALASALFAQATTVTCSSKQGERQNCPADTSAGVALHRSLGPAECLLDKTWGYNGDTIWVYDGCSGEFLLGQLATSPTPTPAPSPEPQARQPIETWGAVESGKGFLVGRTEVGELSISAYALTRYLNQLLAHQTFIDHLGFQHEVHTRNDIFSHRIMVFFGGWIGLPRLRHQIIVWTVNTTDQKKPAQSSGHPCEPIARQQLLRLLRWRPEGHNRCGSPVDIFLTMEVRNR